MRNSSSDIQSPRYLSSVFSVANQYYQKAKSVNSSLGSKIGTIEVWMQPYAEPILTYSEPYINTFDIQLSSILNKTSGYIHTFSNSVPQSLAEKKRFYMGCIQVWLSNDLNYEHLIRTLQTLYSETLTQEMIRSAEDFYQSAKTYNGELNNIPDFTAHVLSQGNSKIHQALKNAWFDKKVSNQRQFVQKVQGDLNEVWNDELKEISQLYYGLCLLQRDIKFGIAVTKQTKNSVMENALEVADKTSYIILAGLDEMYNWAVNSLDQKFISRWIPVPKTEIQLRGSDRLLAINHRIISEFSLSLHSILEKLPTYSDITSIQPYKAFIQSKLESLQNIKLEDIKESDFPQQTIESLDSMLEKVGLNKLVLIFHSKIWFKFDKDQDGKVSVGDLYQTVMVLGNLSPLRFVQDLLKKSSELK